MIRNVLIYISLFATGMTGGIFAEEIFWPYIVERPLLQKYNLSSAPIYVTEVKEVTVEENVVLVEAIDRVENTVVGVRSVLKNGMRIEGSGLIVTSDGLMVTLSELVPQGASSTFFIDGQQKPFQIIKRDAKLNLALVKLSETNLRAPGFVDISQIKTGERVFIVGASFDGDAVTKAANEGIVRLADEDGIQSSIIEKNFMAGSSMFNIKGEVMGLNDVDLTGRVTAIPIAKIKEFTNL